MSNFLVTLLISFAVIALSIGALAIGWLITGKQKLKPGACGRDPNKKKDKDCGAAANCQLCEKQEGKSKP